MVKRILTMLIAVIMGFAVLTGCNKKDKKDPDATASPAPDEASTTDYIGIIGGEKIYASEFKYFFYDALREVDFSVIGIPDDATEKEQYDLMLAYLEEKDEDGVSRLDKAAERAVELSAMFKITYLEGVKAGFQLTDEDKEDQYKSISDFIDQYLSYYGEQYQVTTRDDMMRIMYSMNVNDYKRLAVQQVVSNKYATDIMGKMDPSDEELLAFYNENIDQYRIVTVRHILLKTQDDEGNALSEEEKAAKYEKAQRVKAKIEAGEDEIDALVKGYSEDTDLSNLGIYEVSKNSGFVKEFENWALKQEEVTDTVEIIETSYGYHVMMCEGIKTNEDETVKANILSGYKNELFDNQIKAMLGTDSYTITERNEALIKKSTEDFITKLFEAPEEATPSPSPSASPSPEATPSSTED